MGKTPDEIKKIYAIPHFHYDVEWWKPEDGYNVDVEMILDRALEMLEEHREFTYVIDQALALKPYWDKHPEKHDAIRRFAGEGRLEMIGGTWCSPDVNIPTGEAIARQYVYGLKFFEDEVGCGVTTAWEIDTFGHSAQFPQIAAGAGMKGFTFSRGVQNWRDESSPIHFYWEAPDGTRILTNWFAAHYVGFAPVGDMPVGGPLGGKKAFKKEMKGRISYEGKRADGEILMFPFGSDFVIPTEEWLDLVEQWNESGEGPEVEFSLPGRFFENLENEYGDNLPVVRGELNPMLTGCYESREKVKKLCRKSQYEILSSEKWAALASALLGAEYPKNDLDRAWGLILENDFHDIICGTGTDVVYQNTLSRYEEALSLVEKAGKTARERLASEYAYAKGSGVKVAAFNSLNWAREDIVSISLSDIATGVGQSGNYKVKGPDGKAIASQAVDGKLIFKAAAPPMGFAVYDISSVKQPVKNATDLKIDDNTIENEFIKLKIDERTGGIESIFDKEQGCDILVPSNRQCNEIVMEEDAGNLWTVQKTGREWTSAEGKSETRIIEAGPVRAGFETITKMKEMNIVRKTYLTTGSRRVDFETSIDFKGKDKRVKVVFSPAFSGKPVFETPFHAEAREPGHHCAQNWVDISNGKSGLAVLNSGNPGTDADYDSIGLVLFRSVSVFSGAFLRFIGNNWKDILKMGREAMKYASMGIGMSLTEWAFYDAHGLFLREWSSAGVPQNKPGLNVGEHLIPYLNWNKESDAWERGKHEFRYAAYPHAGDWRVDNLPRRGWEFNTPLETMALNKGGKGSEKTKSMFDIGNDEGIILTALKNSDRAGENKLIARIYDALGSGGVASISLGDDEKIKCRKTNIAEREKGASLKKTKTGAHAKLRPWEISSILIEK